MNQIYKGILRDFNLRSNRVYIITNIISNSMLYLP